jgi:hypothetical protein
MSLAKAQLGAAALGCLSISTFAYDVITQTGPAGRLAIGLAVAAATLFACARIKASADQTCAAIEHAVGQNMDASLGVAAQFGRDSERRRIEAGAQLAAVREIRPHGRGGKR